MSYKSFKDISDVCEKFDLDYEKENFIKEKKFRPEETYYSRIEYFLNDDASYSSEAAICERIIFPIIFEAAHNNKLPVWSQLQFNVDKNLGLTGNPDFIIAPPLRGNRKFKLPVVCLGEAKKNDFEKGWGQVGAEMVAAQIANIKKIKEDIEKKDKFPNTFLEEIINIKKRKTTKNNESKFDEKLLQEIMNIPIYGLVTNGLEWEFGKLENSVFKMNKSKIIGSDNLQKVFDTLNWMFCEARKNVDQLLMLNS